MPRNIFVSVSRLRQKGWPLPRFRHATEKLHSGILLIREELVDDRHVRVAPPVYPDTGAEVEALPRLLKVEIVCQKTEEMALAGLERSEDLARTIDRAQEWRVAFSGTSQAE